MQTGPRLVYFVQGFVRADVRWDMPYVSNACRGTHAIDAQTVITVVCAMVASVWFQSAKQRWQQQWCKMQTGVLQGQEHEGHCIAVMRPKALLRCASPLTRSIRVVCVDLIVLCPPPHPAWLPQCLASCLPLQFQFKVHSTPTG
jgi:hypothetical protein